MNEAKLLTFLALGFTEEQAIEIVVTLAKQYGYGNLIAHLKREWAEYLIDTYGFENSIALQATDVSAYPLRKQS